MLDLDQKYLEFIENLQEGIWMIDQNANTVFANSCMATMLGYTKEEMNGKHLFFFMDEPAIELAKKNLQRRAEGISETHTFEFTHKTGEKVFTTLNTYPLLDSDGKYNGSIAAITNITERKKLEEIAKQFEVKFKAVFDYASIGLAILTNQLQIIDANKKMCEQLQYSKAELLNLNIAELVAPEYKHELKVNIDNLITGTSSAFVVEYKYIRKDSSIGWGVTNFFIVDEKANSELKIIFTLRDITKQKILEHEILEQEALFKGVLDNSSAAITIWDRELRNIYHNQAAFHQVGRKVEQVPPGRYLREGLKNYPELYEKWEKRLKLCFETGNTYSFSDEDLINGMTIFSENNLNPIKDSNGNVFAAAIIFRDVTGKKMLEKQFLEKSNFTALGKVAAQISHEIKSPLASIAMNMELLEQEKNLTARQSKSIAISKDAINRLNNLLNDILSISHEFELKNSDFDIKSLVNELLILLQSVMIKRNIVFKNKVDSQMLHGDSEKIFAALLNIIENSLEALDNYGLIEVYSQSDFNNGFFELFIKDSGDGIQEADKLFELFYTTKAKGTGLGLPIAKNIMEKHGGDVVLLSSKPGETIFKLTLPLNDKNKK